MQPVVIEGSTSVGANSISANILTAGSNTAARRYQRAPFYARGKVVAVISAAGLTMDFDYGSKNVIANTTPRISATMEEPYDILNEDFYLNEGDMMIFRVANTTAGALTITWRIVLTPTDQMLPDCRVTQNFLSVPAGSVSLPLLNGNRYERPPVDCFANFFTSASAVGLTREINVSTENIAPPVAVNPTNRMPMDPLDITAQGVEAPQDQELDLSVSNSTGGALTIFWKLKLQELVRT